jgi:hypothetical protein
MPSRRLSARVSRRDGWTPGLPGSISGRLTGPGWSRAMSRMDCNSAMESLVIQPPWSSTGAACSTGRGGAIGCGGAICGGGSAAQDGGGAGRSRTRSFHGCSATGTSGVRLNRSRNPVSQPARRTGSGGTGTEPNNRPRGASGPGRTSYRGNSERVPATSGRPNVALTRIGGRGRTATAGGTATGAGSRAGRSLRRNGQRMILPPQPNQPRSTEITRPAGWTRTMGPRRGGR